jgi:hypothetical protein
MCDQLKGKLETKKDKIKYFRESIHYREQELEKKDGILRKIAQAKDELER